MNCWPSTHTHIQMCRSEKLLETIYSIATMQYVDYSNHGTILLVCLKVEAKKDGFFFLCVKWQKPLYKTKLEEKLYVHVYVYISFVLFDIKYLHRQQCMSFTFHFKNCSLYVYFSIFYEVHNISSNILLTFICNGSSS